MRRRSLEQDLVNAARSAVDGEEVTAPAKTLAALEEEHLLLSERRRRLHESIDLLVGLDRIRPDAAARLEKYQTVEKEISWQRSDLYRKICALHSQNARISDPNDASQRVGWPKPPSGRPGASPPPEACDAPPAERRRLPSPRKQLSGRRRPSDAKTCGFATG